MKFTPSKWIDTITNSIGKNVYLETTDGIRRSGRISGLTCRTMKFNGDKADLPTEIELNGDPNDRIPLDRVTWMDITDVQ